MAMLSKDKRRKLEKLLNLANVKTSTCTIECIACVMSPKMPQRINIEPSSRGCVLFAQNPCKIHQTL
eukprot:237770-Amphidinium_carterae.1